MNTETLINSSTESLRKSNQSQKIKALDNAKTGAERNQCGSGVCQVTWKPQGTTGKTSEPGKTSA